MGKLSMFVMIVVMVANVFGCSSRNVGERQPMPASTMAVLDRIDDCDDRYWIYARNRDDDAYAACLENPPVSQSQCALDYDAAKEQSWNAYEDCLINLPIVSHDCVLQLQPFSQEQDTDGDGVEDFWEYQMGLNPCEPCSYGGTPGVDCDGDLDYDRDPRNNADDTNPICGMLWDDAWHNENADYGLNDGGCV